MSNFTPLIVIPSRLASSRLTNKPLAMIGGIPMIVHCLHRAQESEIADVVVAAADVEIADAVQKAGGQVVMTDPDLQSGSDRVAEAVSKIDPQKKYSHVINFQGDLPLFNPSGLRYLMQDLSLDRPIVRTLVTPITDMADMNKDAVVKVHAGFENEAEGSVARAISFSRAAVPWGQGTYWHHVGIYGYPRHVLEEFVQWPQSILEKRESLEQLRLLEHGVAMEAVIIQDVALGVDTPEDLAEVQKQWAVKQGG